MDSAEPPERTRRSTAQPVAWCPPLCRRTRHHYYFFSLKVPFPGGPSPCPSHYRKALGYYAASALLSTKLAFSLPFGSGGSGVPCLCSYEVIVIFSLPSIRRANNGKALDTQRRYPDGRSTILVRVSQPVSLFEGDDASNKGFSRQRRSQG